MGNDACHLLLLHQQGLCQLPVDVIKDKPLPPEVINAGAQHLIVTSGYCCVTCRYGVRKQYNMHPECGL